MDKKYHFFRLLPGILIFTALFKPAYSQYVLKQASEQEELYNYAKAIPVYQKAYKRKPTLASAQGLAESYRLTKNYVFAESWYAKVVAMDDHRAEDELHYAEVLINNSKYAEAGKVLDGYLEKDPKNKIAINMRQGCDSALKWMAAPERGDLRNIQALNSRWSDWGTSFMHDKIIFASDRPYDSLRKKPFFNTSNIKRKIYGWTGNSYLHLYQGDGIDSVHTQLLSRKINGNYHSATASYTSDGNGIYYAVTDLVKKKRNFLSREKPYTLNIEIMENNRDTLGNWEKADLFPYNKVFNYSVGDPWISADGQVLYFVADYGEKSYGGTDIYYSRKTADGWQMPINMGPDINTAGNERTPFFASPDTLYFATDGRPGMGGLDIYRAVKRRGKWHVENMGSPVNSPADDFAPAFKGSNSLYFSSNRPGGKGSDDIYCFNAAVILKFRLEGKVLEKKTHMPLSNAVVTLRNQQTGTELKAITDAAGAYRFKLDSVTDYELGGKRTNYSTVTGIDITTKGLSTSKVLRQDIYLKKIELHKPVKIENIYFDLDKSNIRPDAAAELDKLVKLLQDNPTWKVEMSSHTDSRASDSYNMRLSQRRAEATVTYLVSHGINKDRLTAKGYGETRLVNGCTNGVPCTEVEHQANRRTEFTILDY